MKTAPQGLLIFDVELHKIVATSAPGATVEVASPPSFPIEEWSARFPDAARGLGNWIWVHPAAVPQFLSWNRDHWDQSYEFARWAVSHPGADVNALAAAHRDWGFMDEMMEQHRPAANTLLEWCREFPAASEDLMRRRAGLLWIGTNLYRRYR